MYGMMIIFAVGIGLFLFWRFFFFFRNPVRIIPYNDDHILAPADGTVIYAKRVTHDAGHPILSIKGKNVIQLRELMHVDDEFKECAGTLVGIFMSPWNVHYNRTPIAGRFRQICHDFPPHVLARKNLGMFNPIVNITFGRQPYYDDASYLITNERASYVITGKNVKVYVTQIAESWVKRIVNYKKDGEMVRQGEVFGLIRMGSQVDLFVPESYGFMLQVKEGDRVKGGLDVLLVRDRLTGGAI